MVDIIQNPAAAIQAYSRAPQAGNNVMPGMGGDPNRPGRAGEVSFADVLEESARASIDTMKGGEKASAKAIAGEADLNDVVNAVTAAELTLQTVVAVRDRMISAYQEIMRMPV